MRTKSWPFWETWKFIFGNDRAYGRATCGTSERSRYQGLANATKK